MRALQRKLTGRRLPLIVIVVAVLVSLLQLAMEPAESAASAPTRETTGRRVALRTVPPMPVISRDVPAFASADSAGAGRADDADYASTWRPAATRAWLAYDLAAIPVASRGRVVLAWYAETGVYDYAAVGDGAPPIPVDYTVEANAAQGGGAAPAAGWVTLETVRGNTLHSRQHALDLTGYQWVRLNIAAAGNASLALNLDIHDAMGGTTDSWLFCGSSSNAAAMDHAARGAGTFAQLVAAALPGRFPVQENGGIGGTVSADGARLVSGWVARFPGRYVALTYGMNDANNAAPGRVDAEAFYRNYVVMVEAVLAAGKIPVVSTVPWARTANAQANVPALNQKVMALYAAYPQVVRGPDLYASCVAHQDLISSDNLHPSAEGMASYRRLWAERATVAIYGGMIAR
jgi:lysophospholipase L1-like esterase